MKLTHINARSVYYTLTSKGIRTKFIEITMRINNNFYSTKVIFDVLEGIVQDEKSNGDRDFVVIGNGDVYTVVEYFFEKVANVSFEKIQKLVEIKKNEVYFNSSFEHISGTIFLVKLITQE